MSLGDQPFYQTLARPRVFSDAYRTNLRLILHWCGYHVIRGLALQRTHRSRQCPNHRRIEAHLSLILSELRRNGIGIAVIRNPAKSFVMGALRAIINSVYGHIANAAGAKKFVRA